MNIKELTLKDFFTDSDHHSERLETLKELARRSTKWRAELKFFQANVTGKIGTFSAENQKRIERVKKELCEQESLAAS